MNQLPRQKLWEIVTHRNIIEARNGRDVLTDPRLCQALLLDLCGEHKREIFVLVSALRQRVAEDLLASQGREPQEVLFTRLTRRLVENFALEEKAAKWAVESWAFALGIIRSDSTVRISQEAAEKEKSQRGLQARLPLTLAKHFVFEPEMALINAGGFTMGSEPGKVLSFNDTSVEGTYAGGCRVPEHTVCLPDYYLARTSVTNAQYAAFLQDTDHRRPKRWRSKNSPKGKEHYPVVYVSWHDAVAYCRWLSGVTGKSYVIPTEAEWEKGASWDERLADDQRTEVGKKEGEGDKKLQYPWGDQWELGRCNTSEAEVNGVTPVDAYPQGASPYSLLDMVGNVWEWTTSLWGVDWYEPQFSYPYDPADGRENLEAEDDVCRVLRGGSFAYTREFASCIYRYKNFPGSCSDGIGFRVAITDCTRLKSS